MSTDRKIIPAPEKPSPSLPVIILVFVLLEPVGLPLGLFLLYLRLRKSMRNRRLADYRQCLKIISGEAEVSLRDLARAMGKDVSQTIRIVTEMIEQNYLDSRAYIDHARKALILRKSEAREAFRQTASRIPFDLSSLSDIAGDLAGAAGDIARNFRESFRQRYRDDARRHGEKEVPPEPKPHEEAPQKEEEGSSMNAEHLKTLAQLKLLNDQIADRNVSEKIDRISELTKDIYAFVEFNPDRAGQVRKFMNYYLPTTLKLLDSYRMLEKQSYQGENIVASRHSIEDILSTLVQAFEKQLDQLFAADAADISSDIQVLETMIAKDGLKCSSTGLQL